jgi:hypothetical protein
MATNKRDLKAYSRFDGTGRIVPGSTVLRRNKPKVGNWKETQAYECCDDSNSCCEPGTISVIGNQFDPDVFPGEFVQVLFTINRINCPGFSYLGGTLNPFISINGTVNNVQDVIDLINNSEFAQTNGVICRIGNFEGEPVYIVDVDKCKCLGAYLNETATLTINILTP